MSHVGVILRLNKGIGRQLTALAVSLKLPIEVKMIGQKKQLQQRMSLRDVVEIDLPFSDARLLKAVKYCLNMGKMYRPVVFVAVGGCGMDKPTVRPRLTRSGSEPAVAHRKLLGQLADYRHLFRRKIVHHILRIESLSPIRRLVDVVFDKPIHGRNGSRTSDIWHPEQLRVDVGP